MFEIRLAPEDVERFRQSYIKKDGCWIWNATLDGKGYGIIHALGKTFKAHRIAYFLGAGQPGENLVDHICHNRACVRPDHLRLVNHKQNGENRSGLQRNNTSGVQGVYWHKSSQRWHARVYNNGRYIHVGHFDELSEAESAVIAARNEIFTHNELDRAA